MSLLLAWKFFPKSAIFILKIDVEIINSNINYVRI